MRDQRDPVIRGSQILNPGGVAAWPRTHISQVYTDLAPYGTAVTRQRFHQAKLNLVALATLPLVLQLYIG